MVQVNVTSLLSRVADDTNPQAQTATFRAGKWLSNSPQRPMTLGKILPEGGRVSERLAS